VCEPHIHIIRDYKRINTRGNTWLTLLLYMCVTHTHEPNLVGGDLMLHGGRTTQLIAFMWEISDRNTHVW